MKKVIFALSFLSLTITGCSSSLPPIQSHLLLPVTNGTPIVTVEQPHLLISGVNLSDHIAGAGLVYQKEDNQIIEARRHIWAEDLSQQIARNLRDELKRKQSQYWVVTQDLDSPSPQRLWIDVSQFLSNANGDAIFAGEWHFLGKNKLSKSFNIKVPLSEPGYDAQVQALSKTVSLLAEEISVQLKATQIQFKDEDET